MGDPEQPKPVKQIADDIIKDDVRKQFLSGRPGKRPQVARQTTGVPASVARPVSWGTRAIVGAIIGAFLIASGFVFYYVARIYRKPKTEAPQTRERTATGVPCPAGTIDSCLVGTWKVTSVANLLSSGWTGGEGFQLTFKCDGTEAVDYSGMTIMRHTDGSTLLYTGTAKALVSTKDLAARIENMQEAHAMLHETKPGNVDLRLPDLGIALGGMTPTSYTCNETSLEYKALTQTGKPSYFVKATRIDEASAGTPTTTSSNEPTPTPLPSPIKEGTGLPAPDVPTSLRAGCEPEYSQALDRAQLILNDAADARRQAEASTIEAERARTRAKIERENAEMRRTTAARARARGDVDQADEDDEQAASYEAQARDADARAQSESQRAAQKLQEAARLEQQADEIRRKAAQDCLRKRQP